tara:strand:- start:2206 stop:2487 length:282 start_codon:yes stop_codon:yes gene_type:complete
MDFLTNNLGLLVGGGTTGALLFAFKLIPNEDLYSWVKTGFYWLGTTMTLGLARWRFTTKYWNKTIEPWFVDLLTNTMGAAVDGFLSGLKSDDK